MTAVSVAIGDDGVYLAADGVRYDYATGRVLDFASKILVLPDRDMAITWAGIGDFGHGFYLAAIRTCPTFDDVVDNFAELAQYVHRQFLYGHGLASRPEAEQKATILIAGYSARNGRWEGYRLSTYAKEADGAREQPEAWKVMPVPRNGAYCTASPDAELLSRFGVIGETDLCGWCVRMVCANRARSGYLPDEGIHYGVGGFVQVAVITRGYLKSWITHRWPDVLGEQIDASKGSPLPAWLTEDATCS